MGFMREPIEYSCSLRAGRNGAEQCSVALTSAEKLPPARSDDQRVPAHGFMEGP